MAKLNRDEILRGLLQTLVDGYGYRTVEEALQQLAVPSDAQKQKRSNLPHGESPRGAETLVAELDLPPDRKLLIAELAKRFDQGSSFPRMSDIRSFLLSHQQNANDLKGRVPAFKRMLIVLSAMSPKGLEKLISRSHHSGPADLGAISDAIRGAGEDLRGKQVRAGKPHVEGVSASETSILPTEK